jgi:type II secretory pathway pseudopilin PulG
MSNEAGFTLVETVVALALTLVLAIAVYNTLDSSNRFWVQASDKVNARATGRAALELLAADIRAAGYGPIIRSFAAVPAGDTSRVRLLSDVDGDGVVGTASEANENVSWVFVGPTNGAYRLDRGVDLNGDWIFTGTGESIQTVAEDVVAIDINDDGTVEPFLAYDQAPPVTRRVHVCFGVRSQRRNALKRAYEVAEFDGEVILRNRLP